jgi:hypothetical protein
LVQVHRKGQLKRLKKKCSMGKEGMYSMGREERGSKQREGSVLGSKWWLEFKNIHLIYKSKF